jgi:hypothetical protein
MIPDNMYTAEPKYEIGTDILVEGKIAEIVDILQGQKGLYYLIHHSGHYSKDTSALEIHHEMYLKPAPKPKFTYKNRVNILHPNKKTVRKQNVKVCDRIFIEGIWLYYLDYKNKSEWWEEERLQKYKRKKAKNGSARKN